MTTTSTTWTKTTVRELLTRSDKAVQRALVVLYNLQTSDEQASDSTRVRNGAGFNGVDATILSSFAKQVIAGRTLSTKQLTLARTKLVKYAGQLVQISNEKGS